MAKGEAVTAGEECPECGGVTIEFRGLGLDTQYRVCPRWKEPGHKTESECKAELRERRGAIRPSGRYA